MPTEIIAQNGAIIKQNTRIEVEGCSKKISILSHSIKKHAVKLSVYAPPLANSMSPAKDSNQHPRKQLDVKHSP